MPYITDKERFEVLDFYGIDNRIAAAQLISTYAENGGQLNYMISMTISEYLEKKGLSYDTCQDILGMLEVVKAEFIERVVIPYEKLKAKENGDGIWDWVDREINTRLDIQDEIWKHQTPIPSGK